MKFLFRLIWQNCFYRPLFGISTILFYINTIIVFCIPTFKWNANILWTDYKSLWWKNVLIDLIYYASMRLHFFFHFRFSNVIFVISFIWSSLLVESYERKTSRKLGLEKRLSKKYRAYFRHSIIVCSGLASW